jgi:MFS family permease
VAYTLRFGNFITSVGSYSCLAFSALMIRQWNQGAFGLSVGLTAALSISLCSLAEVVGLLAAPALTRKLETRRLLTFSTALLILSNLACFFTFPPRRYSCSECCRGLDLRETNRP